MKKGEERVALIPNVSVVLPCFIEFTKQHLAHDLIHVEQGGP